MVDKDSVVLHAREHFDEGKLQHGRKLPDSLIAELFLKRGADGSHRYSFTANPASVIRTERKTGLFARLGSGRLFIDGQPEITFHGISYRITRSGARLEQIRR